MGKQRRQRKKFHISSTNKTEELNVNKSEDTMDVRQPITFTPTENLFAGIEINVDNLKKSISDDTRSVKSFKSVKSEAAAEKPLSKKEKIKLRRTVLLQKIDIVNQQKKEIKQRKKRKHISLIGDTNPLHDALPSLSSLLVTKSSKRHTQIPTKPKAVENALKRKKQVVQGVKLFKKLMINKELQKDPLKAVGKHVDIFIERQKMIKST